MKYDILWQSVIQYLGRSLDGEGLVSALVMPRRVVLCVSSASPGHLCWCVPFTAQPGVWHLPSLKSLKPCCHMLIVLYCSSFLVDVILYCVARIESSKELLTEMGTFKSWTIFYSSCSCFSLPCQKFSLVFSSQMSRGAYFRQNFDRRIHQQ